VVQVVVVGGGWAGCSAALSAKIAGAEVTLIERTDMLLGLGLVGGIMRNNGRFTATEEGLALGGGCQLLKTADAEARHVNLDFPGHSHASLYDVITIEPAVRRQLNRAGVEIKTMRRVVEVVHDSGALEEVICENGEAFGADTFVDATGSAGPMGNCYQWGNGCAMCILRCPTFGPRVSVASRCGVQERVGQRDGGSLGTFSGSCKLNKDSLSAEVRKGLNNKGVVVLPLPRDLIRKQKLGMKACVQYAIAEYADNIVLLDTGHAKLMTPYMPVDELRQVRGLENARYEDPYGGGVGNSIRFLAVAPRDGALRVQGVENLFCAGEKAGQQVGHTEAIIAGALAGHNAARAALGLEVIELPRSLAVGEFLAITMEAMASPQGAERRFTFAGGEFFSRMKQRDLYTLDTEVIRKRVALAGISGIFDKDLT